MKARLKIVRMPRAFVCAAFAMAVLLLEGAASASAGTLDQQQPTPEAAWGFGLSSNQSVAQTFTAGITGGLDQVDLLLTKSLADPPNGPLIVEIRETSEGLPGESILAGETLNASAIPDSSPAFVPTVFGDPALVVAGTQYAIVAYTPATSGGYSWRTDLTHDLYSGGGALTQPASPPGGASWSAAGVSDQVFRTYVIPRATPAATPIGVAPATQPAGPTGLRATALSRCKKQAKRKDWSKKKLKICKRRGNTLPV